MLDSKALRRGVAAAMLASLAAGCATTPSSRAPRPLAAESASYLADPAALASPALAAELSRVHVQLLSGVSTAELRPVVERLSATAADRPAIDLTLAQLAFVEGDGATAERLLSELAPAARASGAARLLAARLAELAERPIEAYFLYDALAGESKLAGERREALREGAVAALGEAILAALGDSRLDAAASYLERLERIAPHRPSTLELTARVASVRGDLSRELAAVRALAAARPEEISLQVRRAELEIEAGDPAAGLQLLERLAVAHPQNLEVQVGRERGKFLYRLANAPEAVRHAAGRAQLTRAEFAQLLYWLLPSVRSVRPGATRIATDALDHPAREEIVRVANLGLMRIDEALHHFEPNRSLSRADAFLALARLRGAPAESRADACRFALGAGWLDEEATCLPSAPVAGDEAIDWLRATSATDREE